MAKKMKARIWTNKQCKSTLKQCKDAGLEIKSSDGLMKVFCEGDLVVSWFPSGHGNNLVRVDLSYFNNH